MRDTIIRLAVLGWILPAIASAQPFLRHNWGTVASLPAVSASSPGRIFTVTDGADSSDCETGGGSTSVLCRDTGAAWVAVGSGGGAGTVTEIDASGIDADGDGVREIRMNGTTLELNPADDGTAEATLTANRQFNLGGALTSDSLLRVGDLEFQNYAAGNSWIAQNGYFDGSSWRRRGTAAVLLFYFYGTEGQFRSAAADSAGSTFSGMPQWKINADGTMAVGASLSSVPGDETGASLVVRPDGGLQLSPQGSKPACAAAARGVIWLTRGGTGVADAAEICCKTAADSYVWATALGSCA